MSTRNALCALFASVAALSTVVAARGVMYRNAAEGYLERDTARLQQVEEKLANGTSAFPSIDKIDVEHLNRDIKQDQRWIDNSQMLVNVSAITAGVTAAAAVVAGLSGVKRRRGPTPSG